MIAIAGNMDPKLIQAMEHLFAFIDFGKGRWGESISRKKDEGVGEFFLDLA